MPSPIQFSAEQKAAYRANYAPNASNELWDLFILECQRRGLIPGVHVVFQTRTSNEYSQQLNRSVAVTRLALITTINALRLIAKPLLNGYGRFHWHYAKEDGGYEVSDIPQGRIPHAVTVEIYRKDWDHPAFAVARWDAYVQRKTGGDVTSMWERRGEEQLAKCAEALGLRMVAPEEAEGLLIDEELQNERIEALDELKNRAGHCVPAAPVIIPVPTVAPPVNQQAAPIVSGDAISANGPAPEISAPVNAPATPVPALPHQMPAAPKAAPKPAPAKPATPPTPVRPAVAPAPAVPNRQPAVEQPAHESQAELKAVADAVARDKDVPVVAPLPEMPAPAVVAPNPNGLATREELAVFKGKAAKIMRDKLEKEGGLKGASTLFRDYILKQGNAPSLEKIKKSRWLEVLAVLEKATAAEAIALVKENK